MMEKRDAAPMKHPVKENEGTKDGRRKQSGKNKE
jgi:hypothetical protein